MAASKLAASRSRQTSTGCKNGIDGRAWKRSEKLRAHARPETKFPRKQPIIYSARRSRPNAAAKSCAAIGASRVRRRRTQEGGSYELTDLCQSCVRDEGRPFGVGFQEQAPNHSKLLQ